MVSILSVTALRCAYLSDRREIILAIVFKWLVHHLHKPGEFAEGWGNFTDVAPRSSSSDS